MSKSKSLKILSVEAKDLYLSGFNYQTKKGRNKQYYKYSAMLDNSLDLIQMRIFFKKRYPGSKFEFYDDQGDSYTDQVVKVNFNYAVNKYEQVYGGYLFYESTVNISDENFFEENDNILLDPDTNEVIAIRPNISVRKPKEFDSKYFVYNPGKNCYERKKDKKIPTAITTAKLRKLVYKNGFRCNKTQIYIRYKRSAGSARVGSCYFINGKLCKDMQKWSDCGLKIKVGQPIKLSGYESDKALSLSSIIDTIEIQKENILVIPDYDSEFECEGVPIESKNSKMICSLPGGKPSTNVSVSNTIWDGQSLMDKTLFGQYSDKGMLLLRNRFFKSCAFNANIQTWFEDKGINSIDDLPDDIREGTVATNISDIKLITTPSSIKYFKYLDGDIKDKLEKWLNHIDTTFGVVKYDKPPKFFEETNVRLSYQIINTLQLSKNEVVELVRPSLHFLDELKRNPAVMRYWIKQPESWELQIGADNKDTTSNDIIFDEIQSTEDNFILDDISSHEDPGSIPITDKPSIKRIANKISVLQKVKPFSEDMKSPYSIEQVANYYEVDQNNIRKICDTNKTELREQGVTLKSSNNTYEFTAKAILSIGLQLTGSQIAQKVRQESMGFDSKRLIDNSDATHLLLGLNENFSKTSIYAHFKRNLTKSLGDNLKMGHIFVNGNFSTMVGNPIEMLYRTITPLKKFKEALVKNSDEGREQGKLAHGQLISKRFDKGQIFCARSPHITMGNIKIAENIYQDDPGQEYNKYLNLTKQIVVVNSIGEDTLDRLSGCDFDSDTVLLTDNQIMINAAKKNINIFYAPVCKIKSSTKELKYTPENLARTDDKTSNNQIGQIVNKSQILNSMLWTLKNNFDNLSSGNKLPDGILDLYQDVAKLSVLSGIEIDRAKRECDINTNKELVAISDRCKQLDIGIKKQENQNNKLLRPLFFKTVDRSKNSQRGENEYIEYRTAMDILCKYVSEHISHKGWCKGKPHNRTISELLLIPKYDSQQVNHHQKDQVLNLINSHHSQMIRIKRNKKTSPKEKYRLYQTARCEFLDYFSSHQLKDETVLYLLEHLESYEYPSLLLTGIMSIPTFQLKRVLKQSETSVKQLVPDIEGDIELCGVKYFEKTVIGEKINE